MFKESGNFIESLEALFQELLSDKGNKYDELLSSMKYSVDAGGKRIRPLLCMAFAKACGGKAMDALYPACAVEFIHTYSLIHDDLPCMDNDDMRRGKPSNHVVFGEDTALLAGDALQSMAFEALLCDSSIASIGFENAARCGYTLAKLCGAHGMVGGQIIDLALENQAGDVQTISMMHSLKTAALIKAACVMGCIAANGSDKQIDAASEFAECIGLQFQIVDDILDVTSTTDVLGKPVNSDVENNKSTLVSLLGLDECRRLAKELTDKALIALKAFDNDTSELANFANTLLDRKK